MEFLLQLGPTLVAVVAIGVTFEVARRQIRVVTISTRRRQWIDSLRDDLSRLLQVQARLSSYHRTDRPKSDLFQATDEFGLLNFRVKLLLDPQDADHSALLSGIQTLRDKLLAVSESGPKDTGDLYHEYDKVLASARRVLNAEWAKIKRGQ